MSLVPHRPDRFGAARGGNKTRNRQRSRTGALMHALSRQESRGMASNVTCWKSPKSEYAALVPTDPRHTEHVVLLAISEVHADSPLAG